MIWPPRVADLPQWRTEAKRWIRQFGPLVYEAAIRADLQPVRPNTDPASGAQILAAAEVSRLNMAELYYVTEQMTDLAVVASRSLPEFTLAPEDLPSSHGLVVFAKEFALPDEDQQVPVVGAAWGPWHGAPSHWVHGGVWVDFYTSPDHPAYDRQGVVDLPHLLNDNCGQIPFSRGEPIERPDFSDRGSALAVGWMDMLRTTWLLMGQTIATVQDECLDRVSLRRLNRLERHESSPRVRVVDLRRKTHSGEPGTEASREYYHRWIVRGHWRNQWYAKVGDNRPIWIAPHIKGPEGAPLLGGEKVHRLCR